MPRVAGQGSGRRSRRGRSRISCPHFALDICNMGSPLFTGLSAMMQNLPFLKRDGCINSAFEMLPKLPVLFGTVLWFVGGIFYDDGFQNFSVRPINWHVHWGAGL